MQLLEINMTEKRCLIPEMKTKESPNNTTTKDCHHYRKTKDCLNNTLLMARDHITVWLTLNQTPTLSRPHLQTPMLFLLQFTGNVGLVFIYNNTVLNNKLLKFSL
jgi:hypothetical protein